MYWYALTYKTVTTEFIKRPLIWMILEQTILYRIKWKQRKQIIEYERDDPILYLRINTIGYIIMVVILYWQVEYWIDK